MIPQLIPPIPVSLFMLDFQVQPFSPASLFLEVLK